MNKPVKESHGYSGFDDTQHWDRFDPEHREFVKALCKRGYPEAVLWDFLNGELPEIFQKENVCEK